MFNCYNGYMVTTTKTFVQSEGQSGFHMTIETDEDQVFFLFVPMDVLSREVVYTLRV